MTEWRIRPTSLKDNDTIHFPGGYEPTYRVIAGGGWFCSTPLAENQHVLRKAFGAAYKERVRDIYGYIEGGAWPVAQNAKDLIRLVQAVWDALEPVIKTRKDLEALYD